MAKVYDPILCMMVEQPATKARDASSKSGELGGIKYEIIDLGSGRFKITMNGKPWKNSALLGTIEAAEKNVRNAIGEILSYERATGKKASVRDKKTYDDAAADFNKMLKTLSDLKAMVRKYSRKIDSNYFFNVIGQMEDKIQYYVNNASRGWYD